MRIATSYALPDGWHYEWCTLDESAKDTCIYPDVGCIHQGYTILREREIEELAGGKKVKRMVTVSEPEARAESLALATPFLTGEMQRSTPIWEGVKTAKAREQRAKEERMREAARDRALEEKLLAEERAKLKVVP